MSRTTELAVSQSPEWHSQKVLMFVLMLMWTVGAKRYLKDHCLGQTETFTPVQLECSLISGEAILAAPKQSRVALLLGTNTGTSLPS